jgi:hypothetical protein
MTWRGSAFALPISEHPMDGIASSPLLGTPRARVDKEHGPNGKHWGELAPQVMALLPTPHGFGKDGRAGRPGPTGNELGRALTLLPTPRVSDQNGAGEHGQGGLDLRTVASKLRLLPTPNTQLGTGSSSARRTGYRGDPTVLSIAESLSRGASTSPPSAVGKPSTGLRLNPSFVGWMMGTPSCGECGREWTDPDCPHSATAFTSTAPGCSENA